MVALARILQNGVLRAVADLRHDLFGGEFGFGNVVGRDVRGAVRPGRIGCEGDDFDARLDGAVDRLDEGIGLHRVQQDARRLLHQVLLERRDLLGDIVVRCARIDGLASAHGCGGLLEAFVDRHPIRVRRHHHVHDVGLARLAGEFAFGPGRGACDDQRQGECGGREEQGRVSEFHDILLRIACVVRPAQDRLRGPLQYVSLA